MAKASVSGVHQRYLVAIQPSASSAHFTSGDSASAPAGLRICPTNTGNKPTQTAFPTGGTTLKTLFLAWQDPISQGHFPIGRLTNDCTRYQFVYTQGVLRAQQCGFQPLPSFPHFVMVYESPELFPLFSNRLLSRWRPEYADFLQWLNIPTHSDNPMEILAQSGGQRFTDTLTVFPASEPDEHGVYHIHFFAHVAQNLSPETKERIARLQPGEPLLWRADFSAPQNHQNLMLFTKDHATVGYCPQYILDDAFEMLLQYPHRVQVAVEQLNPPPAPLQFRLLCHMRVLAHDDFHPFSSLMYQPIQPALVC